MANIIDFQTLLEEAEAEAMKQAGSSSTSDMDFFKPVRKWMDHKKPMKIRGYENTEDVPATKKAYRNMRKMDTNWNIDFVVKEAYPKNTDEVIRKQGWGQFTPMTSGCREFLEDGEKAGTEGAQAGAEGSQDIEPLSKRKMKRFDAAWRFYELRHLEFVKRLPREAKQIYENLKADPSLGVLYRARWGYQRTNMVVKYLACSLMQKAPLVTETALAELGEMKQREGQSGVQFYNAVLFKRNQIRHMVPSKRFPKDAQIVASIMRHLRLDYRRKFAHEDYTKWSLQDLRARLHTHDSQLLEIDQYERLQRRKTRGFQSDYNPLKRRAVASSSNEPAYKRPSPFRDDRSRGNSRPLQQRPRNSNPRANRFTPREEALGPRRVKCLNCGLYGHLSKDCKKPPRCFTRQDFGHIAANCPKNKPPVPKQLQAKPVSAVQYVNEAEIYTVAAAHEDDCSDDEAHQSDATYVG